MARDSEHRLLADDGRVLMSDLRFARSFRTRTKGLLGRSSLAPGEGLAFREKSIHMLFMRMPLDIVFVDADLRVIKVVAKLRPWRLCGCAAARYVLEIGPGEAARLGLQVGQQLRLDPAL